MLKRFINDTKKYFHYSIVSARSQLKSEVASSYLNWIWWVLDPFCFMLIYTFIFGYVFSAKEPYFPVFIFIGLSMWDFFNRTIAGSVKMVKNNKPIVSKVYLPKYILILTRMWVNAFKMMISFGIVLAMMLAFRVPFSIQTIYFPCIILALMSVTFGFSTFLLHYGVFVEDLSNVIAIAMRMLFYLTGIFYNVETRMPKPYGKLLVRYNPMAFLITTMRRVLLYGEVPHRKLILFWFLFGIAVSALGIRKIYKNENSYVKVI